MGAKVIESVVPRKHVVRPSRWLASSGIQQNLVLPSATVRLKVETLDFVWGKLGKLRRNMLIMQIFEILSVMLASHRVHRGASLPSGVCQGGLIEVDVWRFGGSV